MTTAKAKGDRATKHRPFLSKTRFISGLQCHLRLWHECYDPDLGAEIDAATQAIFDTGHEVGELATKRHPGGVLIEADHRHPELALEQTRAAMSDSKVTAIFEAAAMHERVRIRADVLARVRGGGWGLVEVKSSAHLKDVNVHDVALQRWVLAGSGLKVRRAGVLTLNSRYVYQGGDYDVDELFTFHDLTKVVPTMASDVARSVAAMHTMLAASRAPKVEPGDHCFDPYECPYYEDCTKGMVFPAHPLRELPKISATKRAALAELGAGSVEDVPEDFALSPTQARVRRCVIGGKDYVDPKLVDVLAEPRYPIHHLDFEACMMALPRYKGTRPYQALPFQWSNHIETSPGKLKHEAYLCRKDEDPRPEFIETLLASLGKTGTICIYSRYEIAALRGIATALPSYAKRIRALEDRCWDLLAVIQRHYYHPAFHGSFSLKQVLPVLVPSMSYEGLTVQDGQEAARLYVEALVTEDARHRREIRDALLEYCGQDTLAMVKLREALAERASAKKPGARRARHG